MSNVYLQDSTLTAIGDAIREKGGTSSLLLPSQMPAAINALTADGSSTSSGVTLDNLSYYGTTITNSATTRIWETWNDTVFNIDNIKNDKIVAVFFNTSPANYVYNFIWSPIFTNSYWESDDDSSIRLYAPMRFYRTGLNGTITTNWSTDSTYSQWYLDCVVDEGIYYRNASGTQQGIAASTTGNYRSAVVVLYIKD